MTNFSYTLIKITDPHGLDTWVSSPNAWETTITEPAGRSLKIIYTSFNNTRVVDRVEEWSSASSGARRSVQYNYTMFGSVAALDNVVYFGDPLLTARYGYQNSNDPDVTRPLIAWCEDPMFSGPMWKIAYEFRPSGSGRYGQILREKHPNGTPVSTLGLNGNTRTEQRGDGPVRYFDYSAGKLTSWTDFKNQRSYKFYDSNGYVWAVTDARGHTTTTARESLIGANQLTTHPDQTTRAHSYPAGNPYFVQYWGNERGKTTFYTRDGANRPTKIWYPDYPSGPTEEFSYNSFGQVLTHQMTSGGTQKFEYDGRGLTTAYRDPYRATGNPSAWYQYDSMDRLWKVTDVRGGYPGDPNYTTTFEYNTRGQVTKIVHPGGVNYAQNAYNPDGTLAWTKDELGHTTSYAHDDYRRVTSVTNALNQTNSVNYAQDWSNPYVHTTTSVKGAFSAGGRQIHYAYDENWQRSIMREPTAEVDAWTWYGYDAAGNMTWMQDPRGYATSYEFDSRNRRTAAYAPLSQTMRWEYDGADNMTKETRPDTLFRRWEYDSLNRVIQTYGFGNEGTGYLRDLAGNVTRMTDAKGAQYSFSYDLLNRKTNATYPSDRSGSIQSESWVYDIAGNLNYYRNPANQYRYFTFDGRNRNTYSYWSGVTGVGPAITTSYDAASRVTSISTNSNQTIVSFGYDDANRKIWEDQTLAGYATKRVRSDIDPDGFRSNIVVTDPWAEHFRTYFNYTGRGQLKEVRDGATNPFFDFNYDPNGNMTKRQGHWWSPNSTNMQYDELNRITQVEQTGWNNGPFARSHQQYDSLSRVSTTWRDEWGGKGERFTYDAYGQLNTAVYNADQVWTGNPLNPTRSVTYNQDALNRQSVSESIAGPANGLAVTYFDNMDFTGHSVSRTEATVDWNWGGGSPDATIGVDTFSARWEGQVVPRYSQTYTFYTRSDDGVRLWVNGALLINNWTDHAYTENSGAITLTAGQRYDIKLEYYENGGGAALALLWSSASEPQEVIPQSQLFPSTETGSYGRSQMNQYHPVRNQSAEYDARFNLTSYDGVSYSYNAANQLMSASKTGASMQNIYDGLGRCVKRTINGEATLFTYDGWKPVVEWDGAGNFRAWNVYGAGSDEILMRYDNTVGHLIYKLDRMGNVRAILGTDGQILEAYAYDAFGQPTVSNWDSSSRRSASAFKNRFMFTGREWIKEFGIYDYRNRFYHPKLGRFLQPDPIGFAAGDANLFRYCGNDPVNNTDPTGEYYDVSVRGNKVNIYIPIRYSGGTPQQIAAFNNGIRTGWSGQIGRFNVTTTVGNTYGNSVTISPGTGALLTRGGNLGFWPAGGLGRQGFTAETSAANEAGRLLGFTKTDGYLRIGRDQIVSKPGYENNILGATPGARPSEAQIQHIIDNRPGFLQRLAISILNFFGGVHPPAWEVAGYGSPEAHNEARRASAIQLWADSRIPSWMPYAQSDFATEFSLGNSARHRADGIGGAYLLKPGE